MIGLHNYLQTMSGWTVSGATLGLGLNAQSLAMLGFRSERGKLQLWLETEALLAEEMPRRQDFAINNDALVRRVTLPWQPKLSGVLGFFTNTVQLTFLPKIGPSHKAFLSLLLRPSFQPFLVNAGSS